MLSKLLELNNGMRKSRVKEERKPHSTKDE
jgi:hypothetical protein